MKRSIKTLALGVLLAYASVAQLPAQTAPAAPAQTAAAPAPARTAAPAATPAATHARRGWVLPLFVLALAAAGVGVFLGEPLVVVVAGLLLLVTMWGWLA